MAFETEFAAELDSTVTVGRVSVDESDASETVPPRTVTEVETGVPMRLRQLRGAWAQTAHGAEERATHRGYTGAGRDIEPGDLVRVDTGPEAGSYFRVQRPYGPLDDHWEIELVLDEEERLRAEDEPWTS